jgi:phage terminase large subunit-like protein
MGAGTRETGMATRIGLVGPTASDVRDVMVEGPAGILSIALSWQRPEYEPSKRRLTWPNGAVATMFSAEEADRLRGPQHDLLWADELAAWQNCQDTWDMAMFGLRLGTRPRWLVTTTPKPVRTLRDLLSRVGQDVVLTKGSTFDNAANLAPGFLAAIKQRYENTRLGRQELHAELLTDTPGALWRMEQIDATRLPAEGSPLWLNRIVVAVDPAVSTSEGSDETGIVACGIDEAGRFYVIDDQSGRYAPPRMGATGDQYLSSLERGSHCDRSKSGWRDGRVYATSCRSERAGQNGTREPWKVYASRACQRIVRAEAGVARW